MADRDLPPHPVDADRDRFLVEAALPLGAAVIVTFLTAALLLGLPL